MKWLCYTSQLKHVFRLEENVSRVVGQNSLIPQGANKTHLLPFDSHVIRSCYLKERGKFVSQPESSKRFLRSYFRLLSWELGQNTDWFRVKQWILFPLDLNAHWGSRWNKNLTVSLRVSNLLTDEIQRVHRDCKKNKHAPRSQGLSSANIPSIQRSFYLLNARTFCNICLHNWTRCTDSFSPLLQRYVRKGNDAKNPANLRFFFATERTQLNAAHA